ncbi:MAG: toll/interleukin-1 receptor domain-containing protein [Oscillospiraceae bacterium]|nr:toll/interleukin-1 receptor domain-containing protein [Oscillospiraceae bacterium]
MQQVFISYRRDGGEALAQLLFDRLTALGFSVFYDIESLSSGQFDTKIYSKIEECSDFLVVLPPSALDRCIYEEDWVRCEIRHALQHKKNIVPVMMRGFVFPPDLPADISAIATANGVSFESMEYLEARIDKIASMLVSAPAGDFRCAESIKHKTPTQHPVVINSISTIASNEPSNAFPSGNASSTINIDDFSVIQFKAHISNVPKDSSKIKYDFRIIHSRNGLVYHDSSELDWRGEWNIISLGWLIKGADGSRVATGNYTAELTVENSNKYSYTFDVVSGGKSSGFLSWLFGRK